MSDESIMNQLRVELSRLQSLARRNTHREGVLQMAINKIERLQSRVAELETVVLPLEELLADGEEHELWWDGREYSVDFNSDDFYGIDATLATALADALASRKETHDGI